MSKNITNEADPIMKRAATVIGFLLSCIRSGETLTNDEEQECRVVGWHLNRNQARLLQILQAPREGELMVALTDDEKEVVINLPQDMTGHIVFSKTQALGLAELLTKKAREVKE